MSKLNLILAVDSCDGIGKEGSIPWKLPEDMKFFRMQTTGEGKNAVIMGRKTWDSIPEKFRPLKDRHNIVLSRSSEPRPGAHVVKSLDQALELASKLCSGKVYVIGGAQVYREALRRDDVNNVILTTVEGDFHCDTHVPIDRDQWTPFLYQAGTSKKGLQYRIEILYRNPKT